MKEEELFEKIPYLPPSKLGWVTYISTQVGAGVSGGINWRAFQKKE